MRIATLIARAPAFAATTVLTFALIAPPIAVADDGAPPDDPQGIARKNGIELDLRSAGRQLADEVAQGSVLIEQETSPGPDASVVPQVQLRGVNVQVNDAALDNIQTFTNFRPFVKFTQSETSVAAFGQHIVVSYNSSADQPLVQISPTLLQFTHRFLSGYSVSHDGGATWTSASMPPAPGSIFTLGDGVVAVDREGTFYFSGLGLDAANRFAIVFNKSTDLGSTWSDARIVQLDSGGDKEWIAVGRDPFNELQTNVYVTWTSFRPGRSELRIGISKDGGASWQAKTIFAPAFDPVATNPGAFLQFSNPYVDPITGFLYVPFLHFSNSDVDFIRILVSRDAGATFQFVNFNVPGTPLPSVLPVVQPGELLDCLSGGFRLGIRQGAAAAGRFGLRRFTQTSRMTLQPAFAARNGILYLAWSNSTSGTFGDPASGSHVLYVRSNDGGQTWSAPVQVDPTVGADVHHVLPSLAIDRDPSDVHVSYYTQHAEGTIDLDIANSHDRGATFPSDRTVRLTSTSSSLPPTNVRLSATTSTNYDRTIVACYALGEYQGVTFANGNTYVAWGDGRNTVTQPVSPLDPISGQTHAQTDVFFQILKAQ